MDSMSNQSGVATAMQGWAPPARPQAGGQDQGRNGRFSGLGKSIDGHQTVGTYGVEVLDDGQGGMVFEYNSSMARRSLYADAYPLRDLPRLFGKTKEELAQILDKMLSYALHNYGTVNEDGTVTMNWQPADKSTNANYQDRIHLCVKTQRNQFLVIAGFFEPRLTSESAQWLREQWAMRLAQKARLHNPNPERIMLDGIEMFIDIEPAAVRTRIAGLKLRKSMGIAPASAVPVVTAAQAQMDLD